MEDIKNGDIVEILIIEFEIDTKHNKKTGLSYKENRHYDNGHFEEVSHSGVPAKSYFIKEELIGQINHLMFVDNEGEISLKTVLYLLDASKEEDWITKVETEFKNKVREIKNKTEEKIKFFNSVF